MIRQDVIQHILYESQQKRAIDIESRALSFIESLHDQLDPEMKGWHLSAGLNSRTDEPKSVATNDLDILRKESQKAFYRNPYGRNIINTYVKFVIGKGIIIDFKEKTEDALHSIISWWGKFARLNKWYSFQREFVTRSLRDGEVFVWRFPMPGSPIVLRFVDPERVESTDPRFPEGIETDPDDIEHVVAYHIQRGSLAETIRIPAENMIHFKMGVDRNVRRGRPMLESMLPYLTKYDKWLDARMVLNIVRTSIALVRTVKGSPTNISSLRSAINSNKASSNETDKAKMLRSGTIITATPGVEYEMLSPNLDARDAAQDGRTILLALAAAAGLPDVFVTSDFCHSMETEILSNRGWLKFDDIKPDDQIGTMNPTTGMLEFQVPTKLHRFHHQGGMFKFAGRRFAFCVTPQHELFIADYHKGRKYRESLRLYDRPIESFRKICACDLDSTLYVVPASVKWEGTDEPIFTLPDGTTVEMDLWLEFLGYVITEGCVTEGAKGFVQITQKTPNKIPIIEGCLRQLPWEYRVTHSNGCTVFRINNRQLREFIAHIIGTPEGAYGRQKHLPSFIWSLSKPYLHALLDALILGDGSKNESESGTNMIYRTTSPQLADDVQRMAIMLGYATSLSASDRTSNWGHTVVYYIGISDGHPQLLETKRLEKIEWDEDVWCASVPNGLMITRLNGKPFISGNSNSNFAATVVSQNPAIRAFEEHQEIYSEPFSDIIMWCMEDGLEKEIIPETVNDQDNGESRIVNLDSEIAYPPLLKRDLAAEVEAWQRMVNELGVSSKRTASLSLGLDPDQEKKLIDEEGGNHAPEPKSTDNGTKPVPKRVEDREPRDDVMGGGPTIRDPRLTDDKKNNKTSFRVDCTLLEPQREVEVGGEEPEEYSSS